MRTRSLTATRTRAATFTRSWGCRRTSRRGKPPHLPGELVGIVEPQFTLLHLLDGVAQPRGFLEFQVARALVHLRFHALDLAHDLFGRQHSQIGSGFLGTPLFL